MNRQIQLALIGTGNRGQGIFGQYALDMPHRAAFTAVVEPDRTKREYFAEKHRIAATRSFAHYDDFFRAGLKDVEGLSWSSW